MNADPRFATNSDRLKHRDLVDGAIGEWFLQHRRDEALAIMRDAGATAGPVYDIADAVNDRHFIEREVIVEAEDSQFGSMPMHNIVPRLSSTPGVWRRPAPALGEHTQEVLDEAGVDAAAIAALSGEADG